MPHSPYPPRATLISLWKNLSLLKPANSDGRASAYQSSDTSLIPSIRSFFQALVETMCNFDFLNNSGEWNAFYW